MASSVTGEMFTNEEVQAMSGKMREKLDLVRITPTESKKLAPMTKEERKVYLKNRKAKSKRVVNKRERQNRRKARATR